MPKTHLTLFILVLIGLIMVSAYFQSTEGFTAYTRFDCPTRNMSYDIRGDPIKIPRPRDLLWDMGTIGC